MTCRCANRLRIEIAPKDRRAGARRGRRVWCANAVYEQLGEGVTTADAGVIADDIATMVR
jgi:hypothetical protein